MIRERLDRRIEKRLEAVIEPHIEGWLHRFFASDEGQKLISEITADFLLSWLKPGEAGGGYFQRTLLNVIQQMAASDPDFRQAVIEALNPHWKDTANRTP